MAFVDHEDGQSFHILHRWKLKDVKKADHNSLYKEEMCCPHSMNHLIEF